MKTYIVCGIPIEVDNIVIDSEGDFENWDLYIGGVEIIYSLDILSPFVIRDLEQQILKELK